VAILSFLTGSASASDEPVSVDDLRASVAALEQEAAELDEQNSGLRKMLAALDDSDIYLVVDSINNRMTVRRGQEQLRKAVCSTGSREALDETSETRSWFFETPVGTFRVLAKEKNPVWIRPDWSFVEENMPIPPPGSPDRIVRDVMGKYALVLGHGYKIHGTTYKDLLGTSFTHGCINLGDSDLEFVYKNVKIGTWVYIY